MPLSARSTSRPQIASYLATAGALAAAKAAVSTAEAAILYTDNADVTASTPFAQIHFDLDHSGGAAPNYASNSTIAGEDGMLYFAGNNPEKPSLAPNNTTNIAFNGMFALQLTSGATIGSSLSWTGVGKYLEYNNSGPWQGGAEAYLGLRIVTGGTFQYGWARINYDDANNTMTLKDFAIEQTVNQPIAAGMVPEPPTTLLLALGAGGAAMRRGRRKP